MKRWALRILLFLLVGAIVNVAVAWGLAAYGPFSKYTCTLDVALESSGSTPALPNDYHVSPKRETRDVTAVGFSWHVMRSRDKSECVLETGWPCRSMSAQGSGDAMDGIDVTPRSISQIQDEVSFFIWLKPRLPGFAINTVFYAALLWLLFAAPFALRRRRRIKRGLCPKCGYDLRGRRGSGGVGRPESAACPECGAANRFQ